MHFIDSVLHPATCFFCLLSTEIIDHFFFIFFICPFESSFWTGLIEDFLWLVPLFQTYKPLSIASISRKSMSSLLVLMSPQLFSSLPSQSCGKLNGVSLSTKLCFNLSISLLPLPLPSKNGMPRIIFLICNNSSQLFRLP